MADTLVTVGTTALPQPSKYDSTTSTIIDGGRNVNGVQIGSVVRDDMYTIKLSWRYLTDTQWSTILQLFREASGGSYDNDVTFYSQDVAGFITRTMHISDRRATLRDIDGDGVTGWLNCSLTLEEA